MSKIFLSCLLVISCFFSQAKDFKGLEKFSKSVLKALQKDGDVSKFVIGNEEIDYIIEDQARFNSTDISVEELKEFIQQEVANIAQSTKSNLEDSDLDLNLYQFGSYGFEISKRSESKGVGGDIKILLTSKQDSSAIGLILNACISIKGKWYLTTPVLVNTPFDENLICDCMKGLRKDECQELEEKFKAYFEENPDEAQEMIEEILEKCDLEDEEDMGAELKPVEDTGTDHLASIQLMEPEFDFGQIKQGEILEHTFKIKNTSSMPLIIVDVHSTCGCLIADYPKEPIPSGEMGDIKVTFDSKGKLGEIRKAISIHANTYPEYTSKIYLTGEVLE